MNKGEWRMNKYIDTNKEYSMKNEEFWTQKCSIGTTMCSDMLSLLSLPKMF